MRPEFLSLHKSVIDPHHAAALRVEGECTARPFRIINGRADDTADGARICHSLGILRSCMETQKLELLEARLNQLIEQRTGMKVINHVPRISNDDDVESYSN